MKEQRNPPAKNGCTCPCHRSLMLTKHFRACCPPDEPEARQHAVDPAVSEGVKRAVMEYGPVLGKLANGANGEHFWRQAIRNAKAVTYGDYGAACAFCQLEIPSTPGEVTHGKDCPYVAAQS